MRVNNSSSSANEQRSSLLAGARPAHRAPWSQQHVPEPRELWLQSRALAAERDEAMGKLLAAVSFPSGETPWLSTTVVTEHRGASTQHRRAAGAAGSTIAPRGMPLAEPCRVPAWTSPGSVLTTPVEKPALFSWTWQAQLHHLQGEPEPPHASSQHCPRDPSFAAAEQGAGRSAAVSVLHAHGRGRLVARCPQPITSWTQTPPEEAAWLHCTFPASQGQALEPEPRAPPFPFLRPPGAVRIVLLYTFLRVAALFC